MPRSVGDRGFLPLTNTAPARTSATRWGALTARQRVCADSIRLNALASPAARELGPLVTFVRCRTVANVGSIVILSLLIKSGCDLGMAQQFGDHLDRDAVAQHPGGRVVPPPVRVEVDAG